MSAEISRRCDALEECYEFMLAYAAQGVSSLDGGQSGGRIREVLRDLVDTLSELGNACMTAMTVEQLERADRYRAFASVLERDARDALAAVELVEAQPAISSQMIDNLNASTHLRAVLTDLFLLSDIVKAHLERFERASAHEERLA